MIFVAIGANLPDGRGRPPAVTCREAGTALAALPGLRLHAISPWYVTAPVPPGPQPDYLNGVAALVGTIDPGDLLRRLLAIEARAGRVRNGPNGPRVLDLDIIAMDGTVRQSPDPVLPHPRMHERAFVLRPLCDLAPGWRHPLLGRTAAELLTSLSPQAIRPAQARAPCHP
ncbi:MAG: 2-amino-4-hydroxy-6-hydroxymethyldihydropteridine diphosphokinase [Acidisphaera sp.]|nr:2-amino-4-hydroxy-6-hydroxymethyldihydropteridine diphosphokinase [Acidisphaera sp.]MBV9812192.1 2-amino-4-hydroxy-6-hydroxymethyldihydropteridine diphosphokinase [Acetobacteraceae bacterium]